MEQQVVFDMVIKNPLLLVQKMYEKQQILRLEAATFVCLLTLWLEFAEGNTYPSYQFVAEKTSVDLKLVKNICINLIKQQYIGLITHQSATQVSEQYDMLPLIQKYFFSATAKEKPSQQQNFKTFIDRVEQEFSRKLSSIEIQTLQSVVYDEGVDLVLMQSALEETVLSGVKNIKYLLAIVRNWRTNGEQIEYKHGQMFKQEKTDMSEEDAEAIAIDWTKHLGESE